MVKTIKSKLNENIIVIKDKEGIMSKLLESEFKAGVFLEKNKLIKEFVKKINIFFMNKAEDATYYDFKDTLDYTYWSDIKKEYEEMLK